MNIPVNILIGAVATVVGLAPAASVAEVLTFGFTGVVTYGSSACGVSVTPNATEVQACITYDTSLPPAYDTGSVAGYIQPLPSGMSVDIGGVTIDSSGNASLQVLNNAYNVDNLNGFFSQTSLPSCTMNFYLGDTTQTAFDSTALPTTLDVESFNILSMSIGTVSARIDTITPGCESDRDDDGIPDDEDVCPDSDLSDTVIIASCDSNVTNEWFEDGCTIADNVAWCEEEASNHGQYRRCVNSVLDELQKDGYLTGPEKDEIKACAAQADTP